MEIPVICRHCGKEEGLYEYGEINLGVFEAWRQTSVAWDASKNALVVTVSKRVEWETPASSTGRTSTGLPVSLARTAAKRPGR